jgi:hypothetical protein
MVRDLDLFYQRTERLTLNWEECFNDEEGER